MYTQNHACGKCPVTVAIIDLPWPFLLLASSNTITFEISMSDQSWFGTMWHTACGPCLHIHL